MLEQPHIIKLLNRRLTSKLIVEVRDLGGSEHILVAKNNLASAVQYLKNDPDIRLDFLVDLSCIDKEANHSLKNWEGQLESETLEVFYHFRSLKLGYRLTVSTLLEKKEPVLPSLSKQYLNALWLEKELWDMFGITCEGHPEIGRLLLYTDFAGHPLRKSYPATKDQAIVPIYQPSPEER